MLRKPILVVLLMALLPAGLFAVDGVVLINQSTVIAAGGFPYLIRQPGSYKLSGNLTLSTTPAGNYAPLGVDIAIAIGSPGVALDLNGFSITVTNTNENLIHGWFAIADVGFYQQITIRNGTLTLISNTDKAAPLGFAAGISLLGSTFNILEDLAIYVKGGTQGTGVFQIEGDGMRIGANSVIRHNAILGFLHPTCPSVITENDSFGYTSSTVGCVLFANIP